MSLLDCDFILFAFYRTPKIDKDENPQAGIMKMMKQMYDDGDDEMKRTIAKAWTESRDKQATGENPLDF